MTTTHTTRRLGEAPAGGPARRGGTAVRRRAAGAAARAAAVDAAARLRERAASTGSLRQGAAAPRRLPHARRPGQFPFTDQGRPAGQLPVRHVRRAAGPGPAHPRLVSGTTGPPHRRRLHRSATRHLGGRGGPLDPRGRRPARATRCTYAYGYGLFTGGLGAHYGTERLGCTAIPVSGGMTPRQVQLIKDFQPEIIMVTPSYMLTCIDEFERQGLDPATTSLQVGIFGAEPWTEQMRPRDRGPDRHARRRHLRAVRGDGPRRVPGVRGDQGRAAHLGGPLLPGGRRPARRHRAAATARRASCCSPRSPRRRCPSSATAPAT